MLIRDEIVEEIATRTLPIQVIRQGIPEPTGILVSESASCDEEGNGHWNGQDDGERKREALDDNLARKLGEDVGKVGRNDLDEEDVDWRRAVGTNFDVLLKKLSSGDVRKHFSSSSTQAVVDLGDVDRVPIEGGRELAEERSNVSGVEVEEEERAAEEDDDLPEWDEGVSKVAVPLLTFLDPAQLSDESPRWSTIDKILPPAGGDQEDGNRHGPVTSKIALR